MKGRVYKQPGSPFYYYRFQINGVVRRGTTKMTSLKDAREFADAEYGRYTGGFPVDAAFDRFVESLMLADPIKDQQDESRQRYASRLLAGLNHKIRLDDAWKQWAKNNTGQKERTLRGYMQQWAGFLDWMAEMHSDIEFMHEIEWDMAIDYADQLWNSNVSASTFNRHIKQLRSIFKGLARRAGLRFNVWDDVKLKHEDVESKEPFSKTQLNRLLKESDGEMHLWYCIAATTGLRLVDVVCMTWNKVDFDSRTFRLIPRKVSRKGSEKTVSLPLCDEVNSKLVKHRRRVKKKDPEDYMFPEGAKLYMRDEGFTLSRHIRTHMEQCGIQTRAKSENRHRKQAITKYGFHSFRYTFVTELRDNGVRIEVVQRAVGHGSPSMTMHYARATSRERDDILRVVGPLTPMEDVA